MFGQRCNTVMTGVCAATACAVAVLACAGSPARAYFSAPVSSLSILLQSGDWVPPEMSLFHLGETGAETQIVEYISNGSFQEGLVDWTTQGSVSVGLDSIPTASTSAQVAVLQAEHNSPALISTAFSPSSEQVLSFWYAVTPHEYSDVMRERLFQVTYGSDVVFQPSSSDTDGEWHQGFARLPAGTPELLTFWSRAVFPHTSATIKIANVQTQNIALRAGESLRITTNEPADICLQLDSLQTCQDTELIYTYYHDQLSPAVITAQDSADLVSMINTTLIADATPPTLPTTGEFEWSKGELMLRYGDEAYQDTGAVLQTAVASQAAGPYSWQPVFHDWFVSSSSANLTFQSVPEGSFEWLRVFEPTDEQQFMRLRVRDVVGNTSELSPPLNILQL
ncbi:MAG: hypothetical protein H6774_04105 [Pseudomonadales bacterium]|nr:hypothetical protein [Pseudomonadales bacterium]